MALVDEPFEDVPEGGPDLTREEALADDTLEYVWWVADEVMLQDRRAWWMEHWLKGTAAFATKPVVDGSQPIRYVVLRGRLAAPVRDRRAGRAADLPPVPRARPRPSLLDVLDLEVGQRADCGGPGDAWERGPA